MAIHVQIWTGSGSARVTDMTNSGKRGKTCRMLRFSGHVAPEYRGEVRYFNDQARVAAEATLELFGRLEGIAPSAKFEDVVTLVENVVAACRAEGAGENWIACYADESCRGIDAPKPELTAGNEMWEGKADAEGIFLRDLSDKNNLPCECTLGQTKNQAYKLAAKVWPEVCKAATIDEAARILRDAGCRLHYWCAMD